MKSSKNTHTSETFGARQIKLYTYRAQKVRLIWCKAVCDILDNFNIKRINDLGCNYFQLFKEMYLRRLKYDYFGYDLDNKFITIGLNNILKFKNFNKNKLFLINKKLTKNKKINFNNLFFNYKISNIEKNNLRVCDCTVLSAVLEHTNNPYHVLRNVFKSTKKLIILRTFVDVKAQEEMQKKNVKKPYNVSRFSFISLKKIFLNNGFVTYFILDEATQFSTKIFYVNGNLKRERKFYICIAIKKNTKI